MKNNVVIGLIVAAVLIAAGCASTKEPGSVTPSPTNAGQETESVYYAISSIPSRIELASGGAVLSDMRLDQNYIRAFIQNNKTETLDVSNVRASFKNANGNYAGGSRIEYYAGIYEWDSAIIGWQVQTISSGVKYKTRIAVPEGAVKVNFYG